MSMHAKVAHGAGARRGGGFPRGLPRDALDGGTAAPAAARRGEGRVRAPRHHRHQLGAGAAALQHRRQRGHRGRAEDPRLLPGLERLLQPQEAGRVRLHAPPEVRRRPPRGAGAADREGPPHPHDHRRSCSSGTPAASSAARCSATCGSRTSTPACAGWSATGATKSATSTEPGAGERWLRRFRHRSRALRRSNTAPAQALRNDDTIARKQERSVGADSAAGRTRAGQE